jgi:DNA-binding transcriptional MerR regulator
MSAAHRQGLLKMGELAERSGVGTGTIKHHLREGLLPEPVRDLAQHGLLPEGFVERIRLIKRLRGTASCPSR